MARLSHVLVIDSDPKGLSAMSFGFEREGVRVTTAASTDDALASIHGDRPDAVVVTLRQGADASRFILEGLSSGSQLPVVAVGTEEHRRAIVGQPNVDFLTLPAYLRDVITATRMRAAARKDGQDPVVQGALSEYGLFFLLRTILSSKQSTIIQVERANRKGELKICKGELRTAQIGTTTGAPALNQLLLWEEAALEVRFKAVTARSQFNSKGSALMEDVERFLRDFAHGARALGSAQTVYEVAAGTPGDVPAEVAPVLRLFDGQRSISDVLDESPFRVFDTLRIISRFAETEVIKKKAGVDPRPAVSTSAASPLMESWLKGESERERIDAAVAAQAASTSDGAPTAAAQAPAARPLTSASFPSGAASAAPASPLAAQSGGTGPLPSPLGMRTAQASSVAVVKDQPVPAPESPSEERVAPPPTGSVARSTRGEMVSRTAVGDKSLKARPSMVIDLPAEYLEAPAPPPVVAPAPPAPPTRPSTPPPVVLQSPRAVAPPADVDLRPSSVSPRRSTGSMEIRTAPQTVRPRTAMKTGSIELDPSLMAEIEPPHVPERPAAVVSTPKRPVTGPQGNPFAAKTRTGEFDALEKDFFDREKDLYDPSKPDSFDDL